ncbi:hypothetical protein [Kytococcus sedentarius]|uniref:hypothetical protein n=1 Tax=Kytococcus sedentarius TaxID=1276 RepID=UPI0035BC876C
MRVATFTQTAPGSHETGHRGTGVPSVESLIRETAALLNNAGVDMRPIKLHRLCREYVTRVQGRVSFGAYLANAVALSTERRNQADALYYRLTYADPTGEHATNRAMHRGGGAR